MPSLIKLGSRDTSKLFGLHTVARGFVVAAGAIVEEAIVPVQWLFPFSGSPVRLSYETKEEKSYFSEWFTK
jgi:hypothetical protein